MNPKVDHFLLNVKNWGKELGLLREIIRESALEEELKWGLPCYVFEKKNVIILQGFKEYFAVMFFQGAIMKDSENLLVKPGENIQAGRQMRFKSMQEMVDKATILKTYVKEAIELEKKWCEGPIQKSIRIPYSF
jgi:uncharacterized protein YdeI (YjbR/CyaY-like superfamily)